MAYSHDDLIRLLAENEAHLRRCREQAEKISSSAAAELERVNASLAEMKPGHVLRNPAKAAKYQRQVSDRGRLSLLSSK